MLTPAPSGGGEGFLSAPMLKKNKELNVFHHVWSHLTTSPNACLSSPSDPRCVQPCYKSRGKRNKRSRQGQQTPRAQDTKDDGRSVSYGSPDPSSTSCRLGGFQPSGAEQPPVSVAADGQGGIEHRHPYESG